MKRYKITVEYFGKNLCGWQRQKNAVSVQEKLEDSLSVVLQQQIVITGSGRTDAGVHAVGQVAHFDAETRLSPEKILLAANSLLPDDVRIRGCETVPAGFHAQYGAKRKTYLYKTYVSNIVRPLKNDFYERIQPPVDVAAMRRAAAYLTGKHDFKGFSSADRTVKTTVREIYRLDILEDGEDLFFEVEGNGFLYNMVRIIVGTLVYVGRGKLAPEDVRDILASGDRTAGGKTFPAKGLYLKEVRYAPENADFPDTCENVAENG